MSHTVIKKFSDLDFIIQDNIFLSGNTKSIQKETYENMWEITFDKQFIAQISIEDLNAFLKKLLQNRSEQMKTRFSHNYATFYFWFDEQALQLRFNILSGKNIKLPFECKLKIEQTVDPIFIHFLSEAQRIAIHGNLQDFIIIDRDDPRWDTFEDIDPTSWTQPVYVKKLP